MWFPSPARPSLAPSPAARGGPAGRQLPPAPAGGTVTERRGAASPARPIPSHPISSPSHPRPVPFIPGSLPAALSAPGGEVGTGPAGGRQKLGAACVCAPLIPPSIPASRKRSSLPDISPPSWRLLRLLRGSPGEEPSGPGRAEPVAAPLPFPFPFSSGGDAQGAEVGGAKWAEEGSAVGEARLQERAGERERRGWG